MDIHFQKCRRTAYDEFENGTQRIDPSETAVYEIDRVYDSLNHIVNSHYVLFEYLENIRQIR